MYELAGVYLNIKSPDKYKDQKVANVFNVVDSKALEAIENVAMAKDGGNGLLIMTNYKRPLTRAIPEPVGKSIFHNCRVMANEIVNDMTEGKAINQYRKGILAKMFTKSLVKSLTIFQVEMGMLDKSFIKKVEKQVVHIDYI